ncbi:MAG: hypothetical protein HFE59_02700 [Clostridiales bacterium]|jgi:hypothetical protein|nr:hypothetical protein [Clostridiales bacterium]
MIFKKKTEDFARLVQIKNLPILILDETFNYAFKNNKTNKMAAIEEELRALLKEQGGLNSEYDKLIKTKKIRLSKILNLSGEIDESDSNETIKKMGTNQELVEHINGKLDEIQKRREILPELIEKKNYELFSEAVKMSYNNIAELHLKVKTLEPEVQKLKEKLKEKMSEKDKADSEYKERSLFLRTFIGLEGIEILNERYGKAIK